MIEPYVTEKQCKECEECKPATEFSPHPNTRDKLHTTCKKCRRDIANRKTAEGFRSDYKPKREPKESPTAWKLPQDTSKPRDRALAAAIRSFDTSLRDFRACSPAANLVPSLGFVKLLEAA